HQDRFDYAGGRCRDIGPTFHAHHCRAARVLVDGAEHRIKQPGDQHQDQQPVRPARPARRDAQKVAFALAAGVIFERLLAKELAVQLAAGGGCCCLFGVVRASRLVPFGAHSEEPFAGCSTVTRASRPDTMGFLSAADTSSFPYTITDCDAMSSSGATCET